MNVLRFLACGVCVMSKCVEVSGTWCASGVWCVILVFGMCNVSALMYLVHSVLCMVCDCGEMSDTWCVCFVCSV